MVIIRLIQLKGYGNEDILFLTEYIGEGEHVLVLESYYIQSIVTSLT